MTKSLFKSKIFWTALIPMAIDIVNLLMETPLFPEQYKGYLTIASSVLIIIFRYFSNTPITKA